MTRDLQARLIDAARTALEIIRRERAGDLRAIVDLVDTYDDADKGLLLGAMANVTNHALAAIDELAIPHGEQARGEELLKLIAARLLPSGGHHRPG